MERRGRARVIVSSPMSCVDTTETDIIVHPGVKANFTFSPSSVCSSDSFNFTNTSTSLENSFWYFDSVSPPVTTNNAQHAYLNHGSATKYFPVKLVAESGVGCRDSVTQYVTVFAKPETSIEFDKDTSCHGQTVKISSTLTGSKYFWDYGDSDSEYGGESVFHSFSNKGANDTTFLVKLIYTSGQNCNDTATKPLIVSPTPAPEFTLSSNEGCSPFNIQITNNSTGNLSNNWDFGDGTTEANNNTTINHSYYNSLSVQKSHVIKLEATSNAGCSGTYSKSINVYPNIESKFTVDTTGCTPLQLQFTNMTPSADSYLWEFGDGNSSTNKNPEHSYVNQDTVVRQHQARLIATSIFSCTDTSDAVTISVNPKPNAFFSLKNSGGCSAFNAQITNATRNATYNLWDFGNGDQLVNNNKNLNYIYENHTKENLEYKLSLITRNILGCYDTIFQTVEIYPSIKADFIADTAGCTPFTANFTNTSELSTHQVWDFGNGNSSSDANTNFTFNNFTDSVKIVKASLTTYTEFLCKDKEEVDIYVYPRTTALYSLDKKSGCSPLNIAIQDSSSGASIYKWDYGDGVIENESIFSKNHIYRNDEETVETFNLILRAENQYACFDTMSQVITVYPEIDANFESDTAGCHPFEVGFTNLSEDALHYEWQFGDGAISNLKQIPHTYTNKTGNDVDYKVTLRVESLYECIDTFTSNIKVFATPVPEIEIEPSSQVFPSSTVAITNTTIGNWDYKWEFGDGSTSTLEHPEPYTYGDWGYFNIKLTIDGIHCTDTLSHSVYIDPGTAKALYDSSFVGCAPLQVTFVNKSENADWYEWSFGDGIKSNKENPSHIYHFPGDYVVSLKASNTNGSDTYDGKTVTVFPKPRSLFQIAPTLVTQREEAIECINYSENAISYLWDFGDLETSYEEEPKHYYADTGWYDITLIAYSERSCIDTFTLDSAVMVEPGCIVIFPNAFTPDDDETEGYYNPDEAEITNNIFHPIEQNIEEYQLLIYNRWGELIFESNEINYGWNGQFNNQPAPQDVYIWMVKATCVTGKKIVDKGSVTLIR